jgi:hypothetical protein
LAVFPSRRRDLHDQSLAEEVGHVPERIAREGRGLVLRFVLHQEIVCRLLDRFPSLVAGLLLDDLAVAFLQSLALAALLLDGLRLVGSAGGATVPTPVQEELVVVELAALENAHAAGPKFSATAVCRTMGMKPW